MAQEMVQAVQPTVHIASQDGTGDSMTDEMQDSVEDGVANEMQDGAGYGVADKMQDGNMASWLRDGRWARVSVHIDLRIDVALASPSFFDSV